MEEIATIGLDIGKRVLQVHAADSIGRAVQRRRVVVRHADVEGRALHVLRALRTTHTPETASRDPRS